MNRTKAIFSGAIALYFVIALEVLVMISPFAAFFYSVFNPVLLKLAAHPSTRWLSAFYLPHMVLSDDRLLKLIRIMGSVFLVFGAAVFLTCATQIYTAKFRKKGAVLRGLYSVMRHPQYVGLGIAGLGLSILWPRLLTIVLWLVMAGIYYLLAKDEERRMMNAYNETYRRYMNKTGMFMPLGIEKSLTPSSTMGKVMFGVVFSAVVMAGSFMLRSYTISRLTLWTNAPNVTAVAILPDDGFKMDHRMSTILELEGVKERIQKDKRYLVYFIPREYVMQGMIADTGGDWRLYKQHHTFAMIADWIFNPFGHLREGHHAMHGETMDHGGASKGGVIRRLIFLTIEDSEVRAPRDLFAINALRVPRFMVDVDVHDLLVLQIKDLPHGSGWGTVPTPTF